MKPDSRIGGFRRVYDELDRLERALETLAAERETVMYHLEQAATYIAQPTASEKALASARHHVAKALASIGERGRAQ